MQQAIDYEVRWQIEQIEDGHAIQQATVLFNPDTGETRAMRTKEDAADYRYFPDPDLPPLVISAAVGGASARADGRIASCDGAALCARLRPARVRRHQLTQSKAMAATLKPWPRPAASQAGQQLDHGRGVAPPEPAESDIEAAPVSAAQLAALIGRIADGTISNNAAKQVFDALWAVKAGPMWTPSSRPRASSR
jgi:aspartyl-tRNA(Asn)/glutamyl-tRNA(Gln) amidotransferase subunit B